MSNQIDDLAIALRTAAFPNASEWKRCADDVRARWVAAACCAVEQCAKIAEAAATETGDGDGEIYIARKIADRIRELAPQS